MADFDVGLWTLWRLYRADGTLLMAYTETFPRVGRGQRELLDPGEYIVRSDCGDHFTWRAFTMANYW